ncbi:MAG: MarR family transcriptional regulator, partial [Pseudomonadota bacterium]
GLNLTSYRMMMVIAIFEEISVSDLSKLMLIDRAQISRAASDLIEDGLLEAKADRTSKRKKLLALTEAGRAKLGPLKQRFNARQIDIEAALDAKGMAGLWHAIDRIDALVQESLDRNG